MRGVSSGCLSGQGVQMHNREIITAIAGADNLNLGLHWCAMHLLLPEMKNGLA
jgi:hypothetical protein